MCLLFLVLIVLFVRLWFFKEYVQAYTNATFIVGEDYQDTEDLEGVFSGLKDDHSAYDTASWQYKMTKDGKSQEPADKAAAPSKGATDQHNEQHIMPDAQEGQGLLPHAHPSQIVRDETMQPPRCVMQIIKHHYARYTPEVVEQVCGIPQATFLQIVNTLVKKFWT